MKDRNCKYFIYVGDEDSWNTAFTKNLWGYPNKYGTSWSKLNVGDFLAFYVTAPLSKVIGFGRVSDKFIDDSLFWRDEKLFKRSLWKYKVKFDQIFVTNDWKNGVQTPPKFMLKGGRIPISEELYLKLIKNAEKLWNTEILLKQYS